MAITLNYVTKIISVTSPTTSVTVQELVNAIRDSEDELENLSYKKVIDAVGKADLGGGVYTAITLTLSSTWQIKYWSGVTIGYVKDGTVVGGVGGNPIAATGGSDTIIVNNQVGGTITISGSGVTDQDKADIVDGVWDEAEADHVIAGTMGAKMGALPSGIAKGEALPKFDFLMVLASDHITAATGKTITGQISKDGGAFASITNTISEVSNGMYTIADGFTETEMNADVVTLRFTEATCDDRIFTIITT